MVKPIDLGRPPTGPGFQSWLAELCMNCCAASNRSRRRTIRFLKAVKKAPTHKTLEVSSRKWERFDAELAVACFRFASGEVLRRLKMYRDTLQRSFLDVSGRAALWFVLQKYVEIGALQQVGLSRLIGLTFSDDLGLSWTAQTKILTELVEPASEDLVSKTNTNPGAAERSIEFLYRCARQCPARIDRETMRTSLTKVLAVAPVQPPWNAVTKMLCYAWIRGDCELIDKCRFEHDPKSAAKSCGADEKGKTAKARENVEQWFSLVDITFRSVSDT